MMISKDKMVGLCDFCNRPRLYINTYFVYRLGFVTTIKEYNIGILNISNEFGTWLINRGSHLSSTEIMLLRPDILLEFLKEKYETPNEKILKSFLFEAEICKDCYIKYLTEVPEK